MEECLCLAAELDLFGVGALQDVLAVEIGVRAHVYKDMRQADVLAALRGTPAGVDWFYLSPAASFGSSAPGEATGRYRWIPGCQAVSTAQGPFVQTGSCFYWLHVHANDGIIHIESPSTSQSFTLGQFFNEWGIPLSKTQVGPATGNVTVFFTSPGQKAKLYTGNPNNIPLGDHYQIQLNVGTPIVAPVQITNWGGL